MKVCSGQCPHCRSGGDATAVHVMIEPKHPLDAYTAHCASCGKAFDIPRTAFVKETKPVSPDLMGSDQ